MPKTDFHSLQDAEFHVTKAERNETFYSTHKLDTGIFNEWAVVVLFYVAVHYVDAVLSQDALLSQELRDPETHQRRNQAVSSCSLVHPISAKYLNLYNRSIDARYKRISFPDEFLQKIENDFFKPIREHLRNQLGLS